MDEKLNTQGKQHGLRFRLLCVFPGVKPVRRQVHSPHETLASLGKDRPPSQVIPSFHSCTTERCRFVVHSPTMISRDSITHWSGPRTYTLPRTNTASTCRGAGGNRTHIVHLDNHISQYAYILCKSRKFTSWNLKLVRVTVVL